MRDVLKTLGPLLACIWLCTATRRAKMAFSAMRKMQGITRNPPASNSSTTPSHQAANSDPAASEPNVELDQASASDAPPADDKQGSADPAPEQPKSPQQPTVKAATRGGSTASTGAAVDPTIGASGGLKAFQQRLAAVRNSSPIDNASTPSIVTPQIDLPDASLAQTADNTGPNNGPAPPIMPDIHAAFHPAP